MDMGSSRQDVDARFDEAMEHYKALISPGEVQIDAPLPVMSDTRDGPSFGSFDSAMTSESLEEYVRGSLSQLEGRLEAVLDTISDDLAGEVSRERQHLMLMQEQVDKQGHCLQKEFGDLHKALEQEKTQRTMSQKRARDENQQLGESLRDISKELEELRLMVKQLNTPWTMRLFSDVCGAFKQCTVAGQKYSSLPETE